MDKLTDSLLRTKSRNYKTDGEWHHVVARESPDDYAVASRVILNSCEIVIDDPDNLVYVKTSTHRRMHTNEYYRFVYSELSNTYYSVNSAERSYMVRETLKRIKGFIYLLEEISW